MNEQLWTKIENIVDRALALPKKKRKTFIDQECKKNEALKTEVTILLDSISESEGWLENPQEYKEGLLDEITEDVNQLDTSHSLIDKKIGSYLIKEKIGEGGMGSVYLAKRADGNFEHRVALKIIRNEKASPKNIRRFEQERTIMAGLNHPGIATLFDGGITKDRFPYFIMEYVDGIPIDEYCRQKNCTTNEKINLFQQVLKAVQHAHENLIVHRDLKPGNILVNVSGKIKILDFGISKIIQDEHAENPQLTQTNARLLTPKYASPEQILESNITTATDIYALGIIFYLLLSNTFPFDFEDLSQFEIEQTILEKTPAYPSSQANSAELQKELSGDLDAIMLKAIRKESDQRYRTANDFWDDLEKYQKGLPVKAREDSVKYRTQKFFSRHKQATVTVVGIILLILGFIGFYTWQITKERNQAQMEAQKAQEIKTFLIDIFDSSNPAADDFSGTEIKARELLYAGINKADSELTGQPEIYIDLLFSIGDALDNLDAFEEAEVAFTKALAKSKEHYGPNSVETSDILAILASTLRSISPEEAEKHIKKAIDITETYRNKYPRRLARYYSKYANIKAHRTEYRTAEELFEKADSLFKNAGNSDNSLQRYASLDNLGEVQIRLGKYDKAENNLLKVLNFYRDYYSKPHTNLSSTQYSLGHLYGQTGDYAQSNELLLKAIDTDIKLIGKNSASLVDYYGSLAVNYIRMQKFDEAYNYASKALRIAESVFGNNSLKYLQRLNTIALIHLKEGHYEKARTSYLKSIKIKEELLDPGNTSLAVTYYNYAAVLQKMDKLQEAKQYFEKALNIDREALGPDNPGVAIDMNKLASVLTKLGKYKRAGSLFKEAQKIYEAKLPENHYRKGENLLEQAKLDIKLGYIKRAEQKLSSAKSIYLKNFDKSHNKVKEIETLLRKIS